MQSSCYRLPVRSAVLALTTLALTTLALAGCSCDEDFWDAEFVSLADAAGYIRQAECDLSALAKLSATEAANRADPRVLEAARAEAQKECRAVAGDKSSE